MTDEGSPSLSRSLECPICYKKYATRSSYLRHSRQCIERAVSSPKQKSCHHCANAKTRCDHNRPSCSRCIARKHTCEYVSGSSQLRREQLGLLSPSTQSRPGSSNPEIGPGDTNISSHIQFEQTHIPASSNSELGLLTGPTLVQVSQNSKYADPAPSAGLPLSPNTSSNHQAQVDGIGEFFEHDIRLPAQVYHPRQAELKQRMSFLSRIFRTYPRMMARREQLPPFIHESQISCGSVPLPLSTCFTLSRMWEGVGSECASRNLVESTIQQEMQRLLNEYRNYDVANLVATFQAVIIYSIILLFPVPGQPSTTMFDLSTVVLLQELGFYISRQTLILSTESSRTRPSWEEWVLVNCKRRTMMGLYCFEWMNAMLNDFAAFPCTEIDFMPAPTGKVLWNAPTREKWENAYDRWLGRWAGMSQYTIGELTNIKPRANLELRSEMWLEEADEFGVMYMAIVTTTPGNIDSFEF